MNRFFTAPELADAYRLPSMSTSSFSLRSSLSRRTTRKAGVRIVTVDGGEIGITDVFAQAIINQSAKTYSESMSQRIKQGKRSAKNALSGKRPTPRK